MRTFHISDLLSVTTGVLVSSRHMEGVYDILNFLTGDNLYTHQLPRAARECEPWLATQFPRLMHSNPDMVAHLERLQAALVMAPNERRPAICAIWVEYVRLAEGLPEMVPVYAMGADMYTHIDPEEELRAMVGDKKVIVFNPDQEKGTSNAN